MNLDLYQLTQLIFKNFKNKATFYYLKSVTTKEIQTAITWIHC